MKKRVTLLLLLIAIIVSVFSATSITASATDDEEFTAVQLSLGYDIGMTYYTSVDYASDVTAHITINGRTDTVKAANVNDQAAFSFNGIAPHELGLPINVEIYKGNTNTGITNQAAVKDVCALYLDNPFNSYEEETRDGIYKLVSNLLQYGEYARIYKGVSGSIISGITSEHYVPDELETPVGQKTTGSGNASLSLRGLSVFFDTTNRYYIKFVTTDISKVRFVVGGKSYTEFGEEGGYYFFYTNPIYAKDTNNVISIKGYYDNIKAIELSYSIGQYIIDLDASSASTNMQNVAKAIYNYSGSAETYTHLNVKQKSIYTVTWKSQDGLTTYETDSDVISGTQPSYEGIEPSKDATTQYIYTFAGWSTSADQDSGTSISELPPVTEDTTYYATFNQSVRNYTLSIKVYTSEASVDKTSVAEVPYGTKLSVDNSNRLVVEKSTPVYVTATPRSQTAEYNYSVDGWRANTAFGTVISSSNKYTVTGDMNVWVKSDRSGRTYSITYKYDDESIISGLSPTTYTFGDYTDLPSTPLYGSTPTDGWYFNSDCTGSKTVQIAGETGNLTLYAKVLSSGGSIPVSWEGNDLTGTTWIISDTNSIYSTPYENHYDINTVYNGVVYGQLEFDTYADAILLKESMGSSYNINPSEIISFPIYHSGTSTELTIYIGGGEDADDSDLIYWLEQNAELIDAQPVITNLTNTTWRFTKDAYPLSDDIYNINYDINGNSYSNLITNYGEGNIILYYDESYPVGCFEGKWGLKYSSYQVDEDYDDCRTITITGGYDVTNPSLISWLYKFATLYSTSSQLEGTYWRISDETCSSAYGQFSVEGVIYDSYNGVPILDFTSMNIGYDYYLNPYSNNVSFEACVHGDSYSSIFDLDTYHHIIYFTGGSDLSNPDLISWLEEHGTQVEGPTG